MQTITVISAFGVLERRNTPPQDTNASPADMMFKWKLLSHLPTVNHRVTDYDAAQRTRRKETVMKRFDKRARDHSAATTGRVLQETSTRTKWQKGRIEAKYSSRDDLVNGDSGGVYRSNHNCTELINRTRRFVVIAAH